MESQLKKLAIAIILLFVSLCIYSQEDSRYDSGLNLPFNEKAGNVNPQTGNITLSFTDVSLPGRAGMNFSFGRIWSLNQSNVFHMYRDGDGSNRLSSQTIEQVNQLGVGWSTTLPYIMEDISSGEKKLTLFYGGSAYELDQSGLKIFNPRKSNILWYDLLDMRIYESSGISYGDFDGDIAGLTADYGITDRETDRSTYQLILKDNSQLWFREDGKIMMQQDRTGLNKIWYFYDTNSGLKVVVDTIKREIEFSYDSNGNLSEITWTVNKWIKNNDGTREQKEIVKSIVYSYKSAREYDETDNFIAFNYVIDPREPFVLEAVTDTIGNVTRYEWEEGLADFTYDSTESHFTNIYMLLTSITSMHSTDTNGNQLFKSKRLFEYENPAGDRMYRKFFYGGYMEYYKISREYFLNRHNEIYNDAHYIYHDNNEAGNFNQYTAIIDLGNIKTTYTYSLSSEQNKYHVLDTLTIETKDGFKQLNDYVYDNERKKIAEEVFRQGSFIYDETYLYDEKGNLKRHEDKMGLVTVTEYDPTYSIPIHTYKMFTENGVKHTYETETIINEYGQVTGNIILLKEKNGTKRAVSVEKLTYDSYGNIITREDALGGTVHTIYDHTHDAFPVKIYSDVEIDSWSAGGTVHDNWQTEPDGKKIVRIRSWKVFNSDGTIWLEIDNEGYGIEHFYDNNNIENETINPDINDFTGFSAPIEMINGNPLGSDFDNFMENPDLDLFIQSRMDNPGARMIIDYQKDFIKTYADIDVSRGHVKIASVQKDGLGNVEKEIEYNGDDNEYAVKEMNYDRLGRMIALTDPDRGTVYTNITVNGTEVKRYDKTWLVKYDDLGRKILVLYPETVGGQTDIKTIAYDDTENSTTTLDPGGRKMYERRDWNENVVEITGYGDSRTPLEDIQNYYFTYDQLNRKTSFTDAKGIVTRYVYDERNLLIEQNYGTGSDFMEYDERGQLIKKSDRNGNIISLEYDRIGRNTLSKHYSSEENYINGILHHSVRLSYDNRGNAVRVSNQNLIEHYIYDYGNRVINLERRLKDRIVRSRIASVWGGNETDQVFQFSYTYNDAGMVTEMMYPDGAVHEYEYDGNLGRMIQLSEGENNTSVSPSVTGLVYNKSGVVTRVDYGNGTYQEWEFDNRKRIRHIQIESSTEVIEDLHYTLNGSGDILSINDNEYTYDGFDRITGAKTLVPGNEDKRKLVAKHFGTYRDGNEVNGISYNADADIFPLDEPDGQINGEDYAHAVLDAADDMYDVEAFDYDKNGNRTRLIQNGDDYTYEYGLRNRLEKIWVKKQGETTQTLFAVYEYDNNGNTTKRTIYEDDGVTAKEAIDFEYDTMNRLVKTTEGTEVSEYLYDNAGNRFIKKNDKGTTVYLRHGQIAVAMDIELLNDSTDESAKINRYVLSGDLLAGRVTKTIKQDDKVETTKYWYHLDHLNSTKVVTKEDTSVDVRYEYRAFGEELKKLGDGDAKYTYGGKELDGETNLYYFNARYYDATIGRFINVDPVQDGTNWYVYAGNNPLNKVDPTGLEDVNITKLSEKKEQNEQRIDLYKARAESAIFNEEKENLNQAAKIYNTKIPFTKNRIGELEGDFNKHTIPALKEMDAAAMNKMPGSWNKNVSRGLLYLGIPTLAFGAYCGSDYIVNKKNLGLDEKYGKFQLDFFNGVTYSKKDPVRLGGGHQFENIKLGVQFNGIVDAGIQYRNTRQNSNVYYNIQLNNKHKENNNNVQLSATLEF